MTLHDEYYDRNRRDFRLSEPAKAILFNIVEDFTDRRGLRQAWDGIDDDIKEEILGVWLGIIERGLET